MNEASCCGSRRLAPNRCPTSDALEETTFELTALFRREPRLWIALHLHGSAKAGLDGFASGLSDALHGSGIRLLIVRPGFVIGRMTDGMEPAPLSRTPAQVAAATARALAGGRRTVWVPWALRPVFAGMRLLPQPLWRRMPRLGVGQPCVFTASGTAPSRG